MKYKVVWLLCITLLAWSGEEKRLSPSFDCTKVKKESVASSICADENLSALDNKITNIYKSFHPLTPELKEAQNAWINKRNQCKTKKCITESYIKRIKTLQDSLKIQKALPLNMLDAIQALHRKKYTKVNTLSPQCKHFLSDLFLFQNFHLIKPTLKRVDYNNTKLKKAMGICWDMKMYHYYNPKDRVKKFSLWESDVNGDGEKDIIFGQHRYGQTHIFILDKPLCTKTIYQSNSIDLYMLAQRDMLVDGWLGALDDDDYRHNNLLIEYQGKTYALTVAIYRTPAFTDSMDSIRHTELIIRRKLLTNISIFDKNRSKDAPDNSCEYIEK